MIVTLKPRVKLKELVGSKSKAVLNNINSKSLIISSDSNDSDDSSSNEVRVRQFFTTCGRLYS